jgi:hypothetical protein
MVQIGLARFERCEDNLGAIENRQCAESPRAMGFFLEFDEANTTVRFKFENSVTTEDLGSCDRS